MWSIFKARPFDVISMRRITLFVSAILMVLLTATALPLASAQAQTVSIDGENEAAAWQGDDLFYNDMTFKKIDSTAASSAPLQGTLCQNRPTRYAYLSYKETGNASSGVDGVVVICFDANADKSKDIKAAMVIFASATSNSSSDTIDYKAPTREADVTVAASGTASIEESSSSASSDETINSCNSINTHGMGWFICPITNWLAAGMDQLYEVLSSFLIVTPLTTDRSGVLYYMWGIMQDVANVLFIVGFLIIIYSQVTSAGISNYGIKRLLPRLIIAAVLVNVSYWISAIAIDLSNILGMSLQNMFISVRNNIPASEVGDVGSTSWASMALTVLAGGAAGAGAVAGLAASAGGSLWFLLVGLVGAMVSALVAILVLAARQALITILVIISPLAFVAYLLPSTEKYFDRWRGLFTTMLVMFPIFSVVFGGASLAGVAIIYSADTASDNYYNIVILGMLVQVAPVVITPLLIKLSGSLLGRVAGIVNDPNKGLVDKTKKFAQNRSDMTKFRQISDKNPDGTYKYNNALARSGRWNALRETDGAQKLKAWQSGVDAAYAQDSRSHETHMQSELNSLDKNRGDQESQMEWKKLKTSNRYLIEKEIALKTLNTVNKTYDDRENADFEELSAGVVNPRLADVPNISNYSEAAEAALLRSFVDTNRKSGASGEIQDKHAKAVESDIELAREAGGIQSHPELRARASAKVIIERGKAETVKNIIESSDAHGDQSKINDLLIEAMNENDAEAMRAYADMIVTTGSGGVNKLRNAIIAHESHISDEAKIELRKHVDSSASINAAAEDIANWGRKDSRGNYRPLDEIIRDRDMWVTMKPSKWAGMAQSTQIEAINNGGLTPAMAFAIKKDSAAYGLLKTEGAMNIQQRVDTLAATHTHTP